MADILTQLQTCLDQLATQIYSTTCYLSQRHPLLAPEAVPDDPYTLPPPLDTLNPGPEDTDPSNPRALHPDSSAAFSTAQRELARDLIIKGAQIEYLTSVLPGIDRREEEQEARIRVLEGQLREMEQRRREKRKEMRGLVKRLEDVIMGVAENNGVVVNGTS